MKGANKVKSIVGIIAGVAVAFASATTFASEDRYIYWMIDQDESSGIAFKYATISIDGGTSFLNAYSGATELGPKVGFGPGNTGYDIGPVYSGTFDGSDVGMTFLVELYNDSNGKVGRQVLDYNEVASSIFGGLNISGAKAAVFSNFTPVPEPTGGMLVLLGIAGLALRRKKMTA